MSEQIDPLDGEFKRVLSVGFCPEGFVHLKHPFVSR